MDISPPSVHIVDRPLATSEPWLFLGISRSTWNLLRKRKQTPSPIHLMPGRPTWRICDLEKWLAAKKTSEKPCTRGGRKFRVVDEAVEEAAVETVTDERQNN